MTRPNRQKSGDSGDRILGACLNTLQTLAPSAGVEFTPSKLGTSDGELRIRLGRSGRPERFFVQTTRTHLSYALASGFIERGRSTGDNWVLLAPYIPGPIGSHLAAHNLSYVDAVGNCHLETKVKGLLVHVEGKRPARDAVGRSGVRLPSYQLIFAILAQPELLAQPVRQIAAAAGIGKTAVADQLKRLTEQGLIARTPKKSAILRRRDLLERWLSAYSEIVRPAWLQGRYRTQESDPEALERQIAGAWGSERRWALGGGAAAWRMNQFYRGEQLVLHVDAPPTEGLRQLRALPADDGLLTILRTPGTTAYAGLEPHLAHPLLVYTEMITSTDPRMRESAGRVREQFLREDP